MWSKVAKRYGPFQRPKVGIYTTTKKPFRCARKVVGVGGGVFESRGRAAAVLIILIIIIIINETPPQ